MRSWLELAPMSFSAPKHCIDEESIKRFPLARYAVTNLTSRARFGNAISHITQGINHLLDADKPHFAVWILIGAIAGVGVTCRRLNGVFLY
jgi:hypothetical protein